MTEQEKAYKAEWQQRQAASLNALPDYALNKEREDAEGADTEPRSGDEVESPEEQDQADRELYQQHLGEQKAQVAAEAAATQQAEEEADGAEGAADSESKDNLILFAVSLFLAGLKDLLDFLGIETIGILGTIINVVITAAFSLILLMRGSKLNSNKALVRYIAAAVIEFIPVLNFLPTWTIAVLWEKLEKRLPANLQVTAKAAGKQIGGAIGAEYGGPAGRYAGEKAGEKIGGRLAEKSNFAKSDEETGEEPEE